MTCLTAASSVIAIKIAKCHHIDVKNISCFPDKTTLTDVYTCTTYHPNSPEWQKEHSLTIKCGKDTDTPETCFEVDGNLSVGEIIHGFGMKVLRFSCSKREPTGNNLPDLMKKSAEVATTKAIDAFQLMMAKGREVPEKRKAR